MPGGVRTEIHLDGSGTGGAFCLLVDEPPAGWALPPHRHRDEAETIHVLEGTFEIDVDGDRSVQTAGSTVHIPRGVVHAGRNVGGTPGRRVIVFSPAGIERFFREVGVTEEGTAIEPNAALASAVRHGWQFEA